MFELTNDQRKCFALVPVRDQWERIEAKPSPYDQFETYLYLEGDTIVKCILSGDSQYCEYELSEKVSLDRKYLLPKTAKGKPTLLSSSTILKRNGIGMRLNYNDKSIHLYNEKTECSYFFNSYFHDDVCDLDGFSRWFENCCKETTDSDIADIIRFSQQERRHIRYQEGDVFRFKIGRRLYGYGRILLDYDKMRKKKEPFWDILMSKPLVCSVYHIVTDRDDVSFDELQHLGSLPSTIIADNSLFYGEYKIIGNLPVTENEDYPVMYGNSIHMGEKAVCYQCGKNFRKIDNGTAICGGFVNNGVSFNLNFTLDILQQCVVEGSNNPYWSHYYPHWVDRDLRNPKHAEKLQAVKEQFGL
jgi:hypothetical protein